MISVQFYQDMGDGNKGTYLGDLKEGEAITKTDFENGKYIEIQDPFEDSSVVIETYDEWESYITAFERRQWLDRAQKESKLFKKEPDVINPPHYQGYIEEYQWLEAMNRIPQYRDPIAFKGALGLQIRKYMDRLGQKDDELQEMKKSLWYMKYLVAYMINDCKPIKVEEINKILAE